VKLRAGLVASTAASLATAVITVVVVRRGGLYIAPVFTVAAMLMSAGIASLPRFRSFAGTSAFFSLASLAFIVGDRAVARGSVSWWPTGSLGFDSIIWLPVVTIALLAEFILLQRFAECIHPSSAVAAAAFMIVPTIGTDVITTYDRTTPALVAAIAMVAMQSQQLVRLSPAVRAIEHLAEPFVIVLAGWSGARWIASEDVAVSDLWWQLHLLAFPAATAALIGMFKAYKESRRIRAA